jgi:hypothetical protein
MLFSARAPPPGAALQYSINQRTYAEQRRQGADERKEP